MTHWRCDGCGRGPLPSEWREDLALLPKGWARMTIIGPGDSPALIVEHHCPDCVMVRIRADAPIRPAWATPSDGR